MFVVDTRKEAIAVDEARKLKIPVIGVVDTNCDPDEVDLRDPRQRRRTAAIRLFAARIADAVLAGRGMRETARGAERPTGRRQRRARCRAARPRAPRLRQPADVRTRTQGPADRPALSSSNSYDLGSG